MRRIRAGSPRPHEAIMLIKRGILQSFSPVTYTAAVLLFEATSYALSGVPVANHIDGTSALAGALCAVLFFDEHNQQDAVIIAIFCQRHRWSAHTAARTPDLRYRVSAGLQ